MLASTGQAYCAPPLALIAGARKLHAPLHRYIPDHGLATAGHESEIDRPGTWHEEKAESLRGAGYLGSSYSLQSPHVLHAIAFKRWVSGIRS